MIKSAPSSAAPLFRSALSKLPGREAESGTILAFPPQAHVGQQTLPRPDFELVERVRQLAQESLLASRCNRTGLPLSDTAAGTHAPDQSAMFFHVLELHGSRRFTFYLKGTTTVSLDERWLCALIAAMQRKDMGSARHLIATRVCPAGRSLALALAAGLAAATA